MKRILTVLAAALTAAVCESASIGESAPVTVFVKPEDMPYSFWRTASSNVISLEWHHEMRSATLSVCGPDYARQYEGIAGTSFDLSLPSADAGENVYTLSLVDGDGFHLSASIAVLKGVGELGDLIPVRCVSRASSKWRKAGRVAVVPIPARSESLSINGVPVELDIGVSEGWHAFGPLAIGSEYVLSLVLEGGETIRADLLAAGAGLTIIVR